MCVIAVKPQKVKMFSESLIEDMWDRNPDGAGFMYTLKKRVYIEKGFMTQKELSNAIAGLEKRIKKYDLTLKDLSLIMHFRITTHGGTNRGNTHPYPVHYKSEFLQALDMYTSLGVAHNGIIHSVTPKQNESDTIEYIRSILVPLYKADKLFYQKDNFVELIQNTIDGSKLAFLDTHGEITMVGAFDKVDGCYFSNLYHDWKSSYGSHGYGYGYGYGAYVNSSSKSRFPSMNIAYSKSELKGRYTDSMYSEDVGQSTSSTSATEDIKDLAKLDDRHILVSAFDLDENYEHIVSKLKAVRVDHAKAFHFYVNDEGDIYVKRATSEETKAYLCRRFDYAVLLDADDNVDICTRHFLNGFNKARDEEEDKDYAKA
jgi:predicted glutamine amidotransferase